MAKRQFNKELLDEILQRDEATLVGDHNDDLTCHTSINFKCKCGNNHTKKFISLVNWNGAICKSCSSELKKGRTATTNKLRHGVEHTFQSEDIREKAKQTNLEKYGVENPTQSKDIQEKIKQTNLEKYGVEHTFQSEEVKEKIKQKNIERHGVQYPTQSEKVREKIDRLMQQVPPLPKGFADWIRKSAFKNSKYVFYKKIGTKNQGLCSACGERIEAPKAKHNEPGRCTKCKARITYTAINKAKRYIDTDIVSIMQETKDGNHVVRELDQFTEATR
jgi:hypothetical protein